MDHIKDELSHLGGMSSNDAFDLLTLGLFPDEEPEEEEEEPENRPRRRDRRRPRRREGVLMSSCSAPLLGAVCLESMTGA